MTLTENLKSFELTKTDALIIIDVQNDFLPGGALAVPDGDAVIEPIAEIAPLFDTIVLTQDWHTPDHVSFASQRDGAEPFDTVEGEDGVDVLWPDHCVMGTKGAELNLPPEVLARAQTVIRKGYRPTVDSYSGFVENDGKTLTGLAGYLRERGITRIFLAGLATDYCVGFTALHGREADFDVVLIEAACRGIEPATELERKLQMHQAGVVVA